MSYDMESWFPKKHDPKWVIAVKVARLILAVVSIALILSGEAFL